jgi:hypothetical protein
MWEFGWFVLGVGVYKFLSFVLNFNHKAEFISDIKYLAFCLISRAYQDVLMAQTFKYKALLEICEDEERLKIYENEDKAFLAQWKKETVNILQNSVPPPYKNVIGVEDWETLMLLLDTYYKERIHQRESYEKKAAQDK